MITFKRIIRLKFALTQFSIFGILEDNFLEKSNILIIISDSFQNALHIVLKKFSNQSKVRKVTVFENLKINQYRNSINPFFNQNIQDRKNVIIQKS